MTRAVRAIAILLVLLLAGAARAASLDRPIYISPTGSDTDGNGTIARPFKSLARAIAARQARGWNSSMTADGIISAATGVYPATAATFGNADSGSNGFKIRVVSTSGTPGDAEFDGAVHLDDASWSLVSGKSYYRHVLPAIPGTPTPVHPRALFQGAQRETYARTPNLVRDPRWAQSIGPYFQSVCNGTVTDSSVTLQYNPVDIDPSGVVIGNVSLGVWSVVAAGATYWFTEHAEVSAIDTTNHRVTLTMGDGGGLKFGGCSGAATARYWWEGDVSFIDQAGEWALCDATGATICYLPVGGGAPTNVWVSSTQRVISVVGSDTSHLAHDIVFDGIAANRSHFGAAMGGYNGPWYRFSAAAGQTTQAYDLYQQQNASAKGGLFYVENASGITVTNARLQNAGLSALFMEGYAQGITLSRSWLTDCGTDCIFGDGPAPLSADVQTGNLFTNLLIERAGMLASGSGFRLDQVSGTTVSQSEIVGATRAGGVWGGWSNDPFTSPCDPPNFNYAHDDLATGLRISNVLQDSGDQGGQTFEFMNRCATNVLLKNSIITSVYAVPSMTDFPGTDSFHDNKTDLATDQDIAAANAEGNRFRHNDNTPTLVNTSYNADGTINGSFDITKLNFSLIGITADHPYATPAKWTMTESFEAGAGCQTISSSSSSCWTANTGSANVSTEQAFDGTHSLKVGVTNGQIIYLNLGKTVHQLIRFHFYDGGGHGDAMFRCGDEDPNADVATVGNGWVAIGVYPDGTNANYSYWLGGNTPFVNHDTGQARAVGWHTGEIDTSDGQHLVIRFDGTQYASQVMAGFQGCNRISFGDFNGRNELANFYVDYIQVL